MSSPPPPPVNPWADDKNAAFLRVRMKTFWNADYFERIILPLLDLPQGGRVLDVGCGNGGISLLLADHRRDLDITGIDLEPTALEQAASFAARGGLRMHFEPGDAHQLRFGDGAFDAVVCQTVLTHVRDARVVIQEIARVLKPGGVLFAAEYTDSGAIATYDNVHFDRRDDAWLREYYRINRLYVKGKQALGRGDETLGVRVPWLATEAGLDVYDVRLNDRALHIFPPYRHEKQQEYLELAKVANVPDVDDRWLRRTIELVQAAGGTEADARWYHAAIDHAGILKAIGDGNYTATGSFALYLTFARKP